MFKIIKSVTLSENSKIYLIQTSTGTDWYFKLKGGICYVDQARFYRFEKRDRLILPILLPNQDHEEFNKIRDTM